MTPAELNAMLVADQIRDRRDWDRIVYLAGTVRSLMGDKHPPKLTGVIGPPPIFDSLNTRGGAEDEDDA